MSRQRAAQFGSRFALMLGLLAALTQTSESRESFHYRYVSFAEIELPPGVLFFGPQAIDGRRRVSGTAHALDGELFVPYVATYKQSTVTLLTPGVVYVANDQGTTAGSVIVDPANFIEQAAIFHGDDVELIPPQPGELASFVTAISDSGVALVTSIDGTSFQQNTLLYKNGQTTLLDFGAMVVDPFFLAINSRGTVSGTTSIPGLGNRGFTFDALTGQTTLLEPLPTEPDSWALDINDDGQVLGYSFVFGGLERIGIWDRSGSFHTYFVEGTPEVPTISNRLRFNDRDLIVVTDTTHGSGRNSYLVPSPGVRLDLADLVEGLPAEGSPLWYVLDVNNVGDMVGYGFSTGGFLLERIGDGEN